MAKRNAATVRCLIFGLSFFALLCYNRQHKTTKRGTIMFCEFCGKPVSDYAKYCRHCGAKLEYFKSNQSKEAQPPKPEEPEQK